REVVPTQEIIGKQFVPAQVVLENIFQIPKCISLRQLVETGAQPGVGRALDDERAQVSAESISMKDKQARFRLPEAHRQAAKRLARAQPRVAVLPQVNRRLEYDLITAAHEAVGAVRADQQVAVAPRVHVADIALKAQLSTQFAAALLPDRQKGNALDAREA